MRSLILAMQFLTRLPMPAVSGFQPQELAGSAVWFPLVGAVIGGLAALAMQLGAGIDPWLGALCGLVVWVMVTGGLHLDGLADLADALGAAHRDPERFLAVLKDPHIGAFGVMALILALVARLVLLMLWLKLGIDLWGVLLLAGWARWGALLWSQRLPALSVGSGERFGWQVSTTVLLLSGCAMLAASLLLMPALALLGPVAVAGWWLWLRLRLGGMTGDCLGAGIEVCEIGLLAATLFVV